MDPSADVEVILEGFVEPGFEPVRDALKDMLSTGREAAAQVCVFLEGRPVVDLCGKVVLPSGSTSWLNEPVNRDVLNKYNIDSMTIVSSSSKIMVALAMALLVDRKLLHYDTRLAEVWPEFGAKGKEKVTVAEVLQFEAGLARVQVGEYLDLKDFSRASIKRGKVSDMLEEQELESWCVDPDGFKRRYYHFFTQGYLLNEVCRRVDPGGRTIGELLEQDVFKPLGIDACIGGTNDNDDDDDDEASEPQEGATTSASLGLRERMIQPFFPPFLKTGWSMARPKWLRAAHEKDASPSMTDMVLMMTEMVRCYTSLVLLPRKAQGKLTFQDQCPLPLSRGTVAPIRIPPEEGSQPGIVSLIRGMGTGGPVNFQPWRVQQFFTHKDFWSGEHPGVNGFGTARGLASIANILANRGLFAEGTRVLEEATWELMHSGDKVSPEMSMGGVRTQLFQGGPNHFLEYHDDVQVEKRFKAGRHGFRGWLGMGGSVLQYHPELKVGFGYVPLKFNLFDPYSSCGGRLQEEVVKCLGAAKKT